MEAIEQQLDDLLQDCAKQGFSAAQISTMFRGVLKPQGWRKLKTLTTVLSLLLVAILLVHKSDTLSWSLSAIGRLALIRVLPYWDWTPLYNTKCLIQKELANPTTSSQLPALGRFETEPENCVLCETFDYISAISNITFPQLETTYLERGLPVIVTDSHSPRKLADLLDTLQYDAGDFLASQPCDLATNIMLRKAFNLEVALEKLLSGHVTQKWFLQLRNCQFKAVKASRVFVTRPYYYPLHMAPFYTSWLVMSNNFKLEPQRLYLQGLIFVQQLSGNFDIQLQPKQPCNETCPVVNIQLNAGECLVYSTDIWALHYSAEIKDTNETNIATILEIDWQF